MSVKRIARWLALVTALILLVYVANLSIVQRNYFLDRRGNIASVEESGRVERADGASTRNIDIRSTSNLLVNLRILLPPEAAHQPVPLLLLLGGQETGKHAVDLIDATHGIAFAAIDYPYGGRESLSGLLQSIAAIPQVQEAVLDTPPALMLAMDWLATQPWMDPRRAELVGVSFGVPFAAVAGGLDRRFSRVWLIHGAADNLEWLQHAGRHRIRNYFLRTLTARAVLFLVHGNSFETVEWMNEIAPRPLVIIVARDDERVPESSLRGFIDAAERDNVRLIRTEGRHIEPGREYELGQLVDYVVTSINAAPGSAEEGQDL